MLQPEKTLFDRQVLVEDVPLSGSGDGGGQQLVNLGIGAPDASLLPSGALLGSAWQSLADSDWANCLQYGPKRGDSEVLAALRAWLPGHAPPLQLLLTSGASQSLSNIVTQFVDTRGTVVLMEDPTYFLASQVIRDHGDVTLIGVRQDNEGLSVAALEERLLALKQQWPLTEHARAPRYPILLYLVPTHNNPTGRTLSLARRQRIVELAMAHDMLVVCDDVYDMLAFDHEVPALPRLVQLDGTGRHVISNGSFSKLFGPGIRLGWIETGPELAEMMARSGVLASGGAANHFASTAILLPLMKRSLLQDHIQQLRHRLRSRCRVLCDGLSQLLPDGVTFHPPTGGYFIWVQLPPSCDAVAFRNWCIREERVAFAPGTWFSVSKWDQCDHGIRLCFAFYPEPVLHEAAEKLGRCLTRFLQQQQQP